MIGVKKHAVTYRSGGRLVKIQAPELAQGEYIRTKLAYETSKKCKSYLTPEVIQFNAAKGIIEFEFIENLSPLVDALILPERSTSLARAAGHALAIIHSQDEHKAHLPSAPGYLQSKDPCDNVPLHGDYNLVNLGVTPGLTGIVIIDWSLTPLLGGCGGNGSRFFDLGWFIYNIFNHSSWRPLSIANPGPLSDAFLEGYTASIDRPIGNFRVSLAECVEMIVSRVSWSTSVRFRLPYYLARRRTRKLRLWLRNH